MSEPNPTAPDPGTLLNELVAARWSTAARHAWRQYEQRGRGAIVFQLQASESDAPTANDTRTPLRYLTFTDREAARQGAFAKLSELVETYDPEQEVVIAAVLPDDRTVFDVYADTPPPPRAAASDAGASDAGDAAD
jgi:hypothetical protein